MERHNHNNHFLKHIHIGKLLHNKYNDLIIADTFRTLALSMISLFIPIFLIINGKFSLFEVALYEVGIIFFGTFANYFVLKYLIKLIGIKKTLILSYITNIIFYTALNKYEFLIEEFGKYQFLAFIGIFEMFASATYFMAHHMYFLKSTKATNSGKKLGLLYSIPAFLGMMGPFLGGIIITGFGFEITFLFVIVLLCAASYSLFFSKDVKAPEPNLNWKKVFDKKSSSKNMIHSILGVNHYSCSIIWPLFMFFMTIKIAIMGLIYLISNCIYAIMNLYCGMEIDKKGNRKLARIGVLGHGSSLIFRGLSMGIYTITSFQVMGGLFGGLVNVSFEGGFLKSSYHDAAAKIMNREFYLHLGRVLFIGTLAIMLFFFDNKIALMGLLLFAGLSTIILSILVRTDNSIMR